MDRVWFQNLLKDDVSDHRYFRHVRGSLFKGPAFSTDKLIDFEYAISKVDSWFDFAVSITFGGEDQRAIHFHFKFLRMSFFLTIHNASPWPIGWEKDHPYNFENSHGREFGVSLHENHFSLRFYQSRLSSPSRYTRKNFKQYGWGWSCFIDEFIFGRKQHSIKSRAKYENVPIQFPEETYHLNIELVKRTNRHRRWPWWPLKESWYSASIDVVEKTGIPTPGKGENSWDCGDDATFRLSCPAKTKHEAIQAVYESVNRTRMAYGAGPNMYRDRRQGDLIPISGGVNDG